MNDFKTDFINSETTLEDIDNYVDKWHTLKPCMSLSKILGLDKYEYQLFLTNWYKFKIKMIKD